jgi:hypothetical protein
MSRLIFRNFADIILIFKGKTMRIIQLALIAICLLAYCGCKGPTGLDGATGSQLKGDIFGYVDVYDVGGRLLPDKRGVQITSDETQVIAAKTTTTDSTGRWSLNDLYAGIYSISASKAGYTSGTVSNFQFVGGGKAYLNSTLGIIQLPSFTITSLGLIGAITDSLGQQLKIDITPPAVVGENRAFIVVYGKVPTVGINTSDALVTSTVTFTYKQAGSAIFSLRNAISTLQNTYGMKSGDKVYAVAYPSSAHINNAGVYTDPYTRKTVYTRITSPSIAVNFQIP